ncbi:hypothetical protein GF312_05635, partial [Candidatus Poribacteria bacterium]|nr:hypothetical protein [Candidatus Poribacteria bacterium]
MAKRRRKREENKSRLSKASDPQERYQLALNDGKKLYNAFNDNESKKSILHRIKGILPKKSVGYYLFNSKGESEIESIYEYYSRTEIQQAMYSYSARRQITFLKRFYPQFEYIKSSRDILHLALYVLFESGKYWPSFHGTVSKYDPQNNMSLCDAVLEVDFKSSWKKCFAMTRPIVDLLQDRGAVFRLKFSGHCSVHIIIPGEALVIKGFPVDHAKFFRHLSDMVKKRLQEPRHLDTSFYMTHHFLRLAYSINENTGLVSLPFLVEDYDRFDPSWAKPERVKPIDGWLSMPKNTPQRMEDFIKYIMRGKVFLASSSPVARKIVEDNQMAKWGVDQ